MKTYYYLIWFSGEISLNYQEQVEIKKHFEDLLHKMFNNIVYTYIYYYNGVLDISVLTITPTAWCNYNFMVLNLDKTTSNTNISDKIIHWINTSHKKVKCIGKPTFLSKL